MKALKLSSKNEAKNDRKCLLSQLVKPVPLEDVLGVEGSWTWKPSTNIQPSEIAGFSPTREYDSTE